MKSGRAVIRGLPVTKTVMSKIRFESVTLTSTSDVKRQALLSDAITQHVNCIATVSGVGEQPVGLKEGFYGALNRITFLLSQNKLTDKVIVSIESFIDRSPTDPKLAFDQAVIAVYNTETKHLTIELTHATEFPIQFMTDRETAGGTGETVGECIVRSEKYSELKADNWHIHRDFGGQSRVDILREGLFKLFNKEKICDVRTAVVKYNGFPKANVVYKDISPAMAQPLLFRDIIEMLYERYKLSKIDLVAGLDARGFIIASALANRLEAGFLPIRKAGKLPRCPDETVGDGKRLRKQSYSTEYSTDAIELDSSLLKFTKRKNVLVVDDLIATGGTLIAAVKLLDSVGATVIGAATLLELTGLNGRAQLYKQTGVTLFNLIDRRYQGHGDSFVNIVISHELTQNADTICCT